MAATQTPQKDSYTRNDDLSIGRQVLEIEAQAVLKLEKSLGSEFTEAIQALCQITGRVVVTGMGKSGHIARKIAATLSSTGTPSLFVHPAEASHGDLGMIARNDAVLALSNSGETAELNAVVEYTRRFNIPLVALVGRENSPLGRNADITIVLPDYPEACPMGLAPTTSTTMALALGDAIAVALLKRTSFSSSNFQELHPGGRIGKRLLTVKELMHAGSNMPLVLDNVTVAEAILEMTAKAFGCVGIIDIDKKLIGIVTDGDLRRSMGKELLGRTVKDIMTDAPRVVALNALAAEALWIMNENTITSLFVTVEDKPHGIIHMHDCLRAEVA